MSPWFYTHRILLSTFSTPRGTFFYYHFWLDPNFLFIILNEVSLMLSPNKQQIILLPNWDIPIFFLMVSYFLNNNNTISVSGTLVRILSVAFVLLIFIPSDIGLLVSHRMPYSNWSFALPESLHNIKSLSLSLHPLQCFSCFKTVLSLLNSTDQINRLPPTLH